jgi:hypothetical protein
MSDSPKLPPARVARAVDAVRRRLRRVEQKLVPPPIAVLDVMAAAFFSRAIYTAAKFGIADVLSRGPRTAEAIANQVGANPDALHRLLRILASRGIFAQQADGTIQSDTTGRRLAFRCDIVGSGTHSVLGRPAALGALGSVALRGANRAAGCRHVARQADVRLPRCGSGVRESLQRRDDQRVGHGDPDCPACI